MIHPMFILGILVYVLIALSGIVNFTLPKWTGTAALILLVAGIIMQVISNGTNRKR